MATLYTLKRFEKQASLQKIVIPFSHPAPPFPSMNQKKTGIPAFFAASIRRFRSFPRAKYAK